MSIIIKKKTTETFLASLNSRPKNTQINFQIVVKKFTVFVKQTQNLTPDQLSSIPFLSLLIILEHRATLGILLYVNRKYRETISEDEVYPWKSRRVQDCVEEIASM